MSLRTYYDPLHQSITLNSTIDEESMVMDLIDSIPFQRLRRIKQLGPAYLTFHGAESSRFTHSLGVFHIARRAFNALIKIDSNLEKYRAILYGSSLLHDLGHGPLSHTSEEIFGINHEDWTAFLINNHPDIKKTLQGISAETPLQISEIIKSRKSPNKAILSLVSSQLDCDRFDYLMRDSYSTGARYGQIDLDRLISALTLSPDGDLAISPKGLMAVEHYLVIRNLMYRSVYNHRLNEVANWLLEQIIRQARALGPKYIWSDKYMSKWLWDLESIDLDSFIANDDVLTSYHLSRWKDDAPTELSELCKRFLNRDLLKALNISSFNNEQRLKALAIARSLSEKEGLEPDNNCGLRQQKIQSYYPYKSGLRLWDGYKLEALENASPIVEGLTRPEESIWLIYPKNIKVKLAREIKILSRSD